MQNKTLTIEYTPLSREVLDECLVQYGTGKLPCLDIELSAFCGHASCVYCDSKVGKAHKDELSFSELTRIIEQGKDLGVKWLYLCGLGEPLDDPKFFRLLEYAYKSGIDISVFTNSLGIDQGIARSFAERNVNLILKCDSLESDVFDKLLGKEGTAQRIYETIDRLLEAGYKDRLISYRDNTIRTRFALSMVLTRINVGDIPKVVKYCRSRNIYPKIGEVEYSGKAKKRWKDYAVSKREASILKKEVDEILGWCLTQPACPATIAGIHIDNVGKVVVDKETGLSCGWLFLKEPRLIEIGDVRSERLDKIYAKLIRYRNERLSHIRELSEKASPFVFGGCGGNINDLLKLYLSTLT